MYLSSGLHGTSFAKDFREEKHIPLTHGLDTRPSAKPCVRGIRTTCVPVGHTAWTHGQCPNRVSTWCKHVSPGGTHGLDTRPMSKPCVTHGTSLCPSVGHTAWPHGLGQTVCPALMLHMLFNLDFNPVRARYTSCTSE